jgi:hypothetical protein
VSELVWDVFRGGLRARAAAIVCELGIPAALLDGPKHVNELGGDPDAVHRFLRALASDGLFRETEPGVFEHTEASRLLTGPSGGFAELFGGPWLESTSRLDAHGNPTLGDFWAWLAERPRERALFDLAMAEGKERRVDRVADLPWRDGETVVDVGGGNGSFLVELFARRPVLRGISFDLPETVRDEAQLGAAGIAFEEGSFFERVPPGDTYVLGTILHDWGNDEALAILRTIREHAPAGSRVLILDAVVQSGNEPQGSKWLDLLMMQMGGRERTEPEWRALVAAADLELEEIRDGLVTCRSR